MPTPMTDPCPWCDNDTTLETMDDTHWVVCPYCSACGPCELTAEGAVAQWHFVTISLGDLERTRGVKARAINRYRERRFGVPSRKSPRPSKMELLKRAALSAEDKLNAC